MPEDVKQAGRQFRGDSVVVRTPEQVAKEAEIRAPYAAKPGAIPIASYFVIKGIMSEVTRAGMRAYTIVNEATVEDFDEIFKDF